MLDIIISESVLLLKNKSSYFFLTNPYQPIPLKKSIFSEFEGNLESLIIIIEKLFI